MNSYSDRAQPDKTTVQSAEVVQKRSNETLAPQFNDNRSVTVAQMKLQDAAVQSPQNKNAVQLQAMADRFSTERDKHPVQRQAHRTGLPDNLKAGVENLSGYAMDDVKVHYNSARPAQLQAHAYAQGTDIHIGPGQEKHLPHEAWHIVQQKQGRVRPTLQLKGNVTVNDDSGLEREADSMGAKASAL